MKFKQLTQRIGKELTVPRDNYFLDGLLGTFYEQVGTFLPSDQRIAQKMIRRGEYYLCGEGNSCSPFGSLGQAAGYLFSGIAMPLIAIDWAYVGIRTVLKQVNTSKPTENYLPIR
jgi:hypothetical protein